MWVLMERATSVPSSGWRERVFVSCSVASVEIIRVIFPKGESEKI